MIIAGTEKILFRFCPIYNNKSSSLYLRAGLSLSGIGCWIRWRVQYPLVRDARLLAFAPQYLQ